MNIPHARCFFQPGQIPLDKHSTRLWSLSGDNHVRPFDIANLARLPYLYHRLRIINAGKEGSTRHDYRVAFANNFGVSRHIERFGDSICTSIEEENLSTQRGCINGLL